MGGPLPKLVHAELYRGRPSSDHMGRRRDLFGYGRWTNCLYQRRGYCFGGCFASACTDGAKPGFRVNRTSCNFLRSGSNSDFGSGGTEHQASPYQRGRTCGTLVANRPAGRTCTRTCRNGHVDRQRRRGSSYGWIHGSHRRFAAMLRVFCRQAEQYLALSPYTVMAVVSLSAVCLQCSHEHAAARIRQHDCRFRARRPLGRKPD